jgi:hypothetical protein
MVIARDKSDFSDCGSECLLGGLPQALCWRDHSFTVQRCHGLYSDGMRNAIRSLFRTIRGQNEKIGQILQSLLLGLPESAVDRFILAPETYSRVLEWPRNADESVAFFLNALLAEVRRGGRAIGSRASWSALGDFYCRNGHAAFEKDERPWLAPKVFGTITLDFCSPHVYDIGSFPLPFEPYHLSEVSGICENLDHALMNVTVISREAAALIQRFVKVIVLRKDSIRHQSYSSSSSPSHIGRVFLRNPQNIELEELVETMLHEAIHQILSVMEHFEAFVGKGTTPVRTVNSPWTGKELPLISYVHACFVWFGVLQFWRAAAASHEFTCDAVQSRIRRALVGFEDRQHVERLAVHQDVVSPSLMNVIKSLEAVD